MKLKLYVWTDFCPDYTGGLAFAIAKNEADAKKMIEDTQGCRIRQWGDLTVHPLNKPFAQSVGGGS